MKSTVIVCDRCGAEERGIAKTVRWARIYAATNDGKDLVGTDTEPADLCAGCVEGLETFMAYEEPPLLDEPLAKGKKK